MIKKILKSKWNLVVMLATMLLLIWSRTFIGIANGCETAALEILGHCALTVFLTFIWGWSLYAWDDGTGFFNKDDEEFDASESTLIVVLALAVICLLSFALSDWKDWLNLFGDSKYMQIGWLCISKKYIYDVLVVIIFPIWTTFIIRKMKESEFATGAVLSGIMQILTLTLIGFLLYMRKPNIWLIEMAALNVITLILAVHGYAWRNIRKKGNAVALLIMYALLWISLISVFHYSSQSFAGFMGFTDTTQEASYFSNVHKIVGNASFIGPNSTLLNDPYVISFMRGSHYLIPSVLFYGGWLPAILLIFVEMIFIVALAGVLMQAREHDGRDIMLDMIWVGFLIRVIGGLLYAFGLPIAILLPFSGTTGIITDSICMGVLLMGYLNRKLKLWCGPYENDFEDWEDGEYEEDNEFRNVLLENRLLLILLVGFAVVVFLLLWECLMEGILRETEIIYDAERDYWLNVDTEMYGEHVVIRKQEAFLVDEEGYEIKPAIYTETSEFTRGTSLVMDQEGKRGE